MDSKKHSYIFHEALKGLPVKMSLFEQEIWFIPIDDKEWILSTNVGCYHRYIEDLFTHSEVFLIDGKNMYLKYKSRSNEIFLYKHTPALFGYVLFKQHLCEYLLDVKEWKLALQKNTISPCREDVLHFH